MPVKKVMIVAGGTGGHVFPGLAVAHHLQQQGHQVVWLGTQHGLDTKLVPAAHIAFYSITIRGIRGKGKLSLLFAPFKIIKAIAQAVKLLRELKPNVVLGMGGYVAGPGGIAAWLLRIPLVIHEQNAMAGKTNLILAHFAKRVLMAFPNTFATKYHAQWVGNPLRANIHDVAEKRLACPESPLKVLIFGGSQGAIIINKVLPRALAEFSRQELLIWQQTGEKHFSTVEQAYEKFQVEAKIEPFIDDMAAAYAWADVVICRAGALTVSELAVAGIASILIPFAQATDDHQTANAKFLVEAEAAFLLPERDLSVSRIVEMIRKLRNNRQLLINMGKHAHKVAKANATEQVVTICLTIAK